MYGHTQFICCFSDPPVHFLLIKNGQRKIWETKNNFKKIDNLKKEEAFSFIFWPIFLFFFFLSLGTLKCVWECSEKQQINY